MMRFGAALVLITLIAGCTTLAGVDGEYVLFEICKPGETRACYSGGEGTVGVGPCKAGVQVCNADGTSFGPCDGEVTPAAESCATEQDEDCDGKTLDAEDGCACVPGKVSSCYSGPEGTEGVSSCKAGLSICNELGTEYGPCIGETVPRAEVCSSPEDESCDGEAGCAGAILWSKRFGDADEQEGGAIATDSKGNVVLTGSFKGSIDFGGGPLTSAGDGDVFVAKLEPSAGHVWSRRFGDSDNQRVYGIATDRDGNVVLTGAFAGSIDFGSGPLTSAGSNDVFVVKLDPSGGHVWSKRFGDSDDQRGYGIATDRGGNIVLTGSLKGSMDLGNTSITSAGGGDAFVIKLDPSGGHIWSKRFGDADGQRAYGIATDGNGDIVLTGSFAGDIEFGGETLTSLGSNDIFVAKLNPSGGHIWSKRFGDADDQQGYSIAIDPYGNIVLTGYVFGLINFGGGLLTSAGGGDVFVAKLNPSGGHVWSERFGDAEFQSGLSIVVDNAGNVVLAGYLKGSINFGGGPLTSAGLNDVFVAKRSYSGGHIWSKRFGDTDEQHAEGVAIDSAGNIMMTGTFAGSVDFGGGPLTSAGLYDVFVTKLTP